MRALLLAFLASAAIAQETPIADLRIDAPAWALDFAVAATDDGAYVAWTDNPFSTNTATAYQMRLASDGTPRLETREVIGQGIARDALAARGDYYAVIGSTIRRSDGTESAQIDNISGPARLAWNGAHFLVVYVRNSLPQLLTAQNIRRAATTAPGRRRTRRN